jgi:hypothetical protein
LQYAGVRHSRPANESGNQSDRFEGGLRACLGRFPPTPFGANFRVAEGAGSEEATSPCRPRPIYHVNMAGPLPLAALLSRALVGCTIEFDNV